MNVAVTQLCEYFGESSAQRGGAQGGSGEDPAARIFSVLHKARRVDDNDDDDTRPWNHAASIGADLFLSLSSVEPPL